MTLGFGLSLVCPLNKALWSPSFVLVVGAYSTFLFLVFYAVIDVMGFEKWSFPFKVIGMNSITIYLAQVVIGAGRANEFLFSWSWRHLPPAYGDLVPVMQSLGYILVCWLFLFFLYRRKIFFKV